MLRYSKNRIKWIPVLIIISQVLLTGFVIQWLSSQYKEKKEILSEDIHRNLFQSVGQVFDSILVDRVIDPYFRDSLNNDSVSYISRFSGIKNDSLDNKLPLAFYQGHSAARQAVISVHIDDSLVGDKTESAIIGFPDGNAEDILLHSFRLILNEVSDSTDSMNHLMQVFAGTPDTILLKKVLNDNFEKNSWTFPVDWVSAAKNDSNSKPSDGLYFESGLMEHGYGIIITKYKSYLIKQISPQILFAIILLFITGGAFFMVYRSLNKQIVLNKLRKDFIGNISHELKTPVSTVKVALEALQNFDMKKNPKTVHEYLEMALKETNRLDELVSKVLNTSLLDNEENILSKEIYNLNSIVDEVVKRMEFRVSNENCTIKLESENEPIMLNIDRLYIQGVLINLIDNSLKYGHENTEIIIHIQEDNSTVNMSVIDNGPGIPEKYKAKIFDKFFRVPGDDIHNVKGYGLGLSFVALVMQQHNGSIEFKNLPEGGCKFTLRFPKT